MRLKSQYLRKSMTDGKVLLLVISILNYKSYKQPNIGHNFEDLEGHYDAATGKTGEFAGYINRLYTDVPPVNELTRVDGEVMRKVDKCVRFP